MLVATGVLALLVTILFAIFAQGANAWALGERQADIAQGTRLALDLLGREATLAMVDTNSLPLQGLALQRNSPGKLFSLGRLGMDMTYDEVLFVAPTEVGNEIPTTVTRPYRLVSGLHYFVEDPVKLGLATRADGKSPLLPSLMRRMLRTDSTGGRKLHRPAQFGLYDAAWFNSTAAPAGTTNTFNVVADNVTYFAVQLLPRNPAVSPPGGDAKVTDMSTYIGLRIGLSLVDRRTMTRIEEVGKLPGSDWQNYMRQNVHTTTNWATIYFQGYNVPSLP